MAQQKRYNPSYHNDWAWSLAIKGATDQEIADAFGISRRTLLRWRDRYEEFNEILARAKDLADSKVERALYEKATGFEITDTERTASIGRDGVERNVRVKTIKKTVAPDTMAIMYWLNNRMRNQWSQRQNIVVSTEQEKEDVVIYLPDNGRDIQDVVLIPESVCNGETEKGSQA